MLKLKLKLIKQINIGRINDDLPSRKPKHINKSTYTYDK